MVSSEALFPKGSTLASHRPRNIHQRARVELSLRGKIPCRMNLSKLFRHRAFLCFGQRESSRHGPERKKKRLLCWVGRFVHISDSHSTVLGLFLREMEHRAQGGVGGSCVIHVVAHSFFGARNSLAPSNRAVVQDPTKWVTSEGGRRGTRGLTDMTGRLFKGFLPRSPG